MKTIAFLALGTLVVSASAETVHGTLVDASGKGLSGVKLTGYVVKKAGKQFNIQHFDITTTADGRFTLENTPSLPSEQTPVLLMAQFPDGTFGPIRLKTEGGQATWKPQGTTITIKAADDKNGPLAKATARLTSVVVYDQIQAEIPEIRYFAELKKGPEVQTDEQGVARFAGIPVGSMVQYDVSRSGLNSVNGRVDRVAPGAEASVALTVGAIVSGRVFQDGKPVPGVQVVASTIVDHTMRGASAKTDANGEYRIENAFPGQVKLSANLGKLGNDWVAVGPPAVYIGPGQERNGLNLLLDRGIELKGQVLTKESGKPVPKAEISISGEEGSSFRTTSDNEGRFIQRVAPGEWYVATDQINGIRLNGQVYQRATIDAEHNPALELRVPDGAILPPVANLEGRVGGPMGKPVANATILNLITRATAKTDPNGHFRFDQPTNPNDLLIAMKDGAMSGKALRVMDHKSLDFTLDNKLTTLQGTLTDDDGKGISDVEVTLGGQIEDGYLNAAPTKTDANGHYRFDGLYGGVDSYFLWAKKPGYGPITIQPIRTKPGESKTLDTTKMQLADGIIEGTVLDLDGKPVAGVTVSSQVQDVREAHTDAQGHFRLEGVPRGKHYIIASRSNSYNSGSEGTTGQKDVVIKLQPESKAIPGLVTGSKNGQSMPELKIDSWTNNGPIDLKGLKGKIVVVDLWAIWCGPCVASLPDMQKLHAKYASRGVQVIGIHAPGTEKDKITEFVKQKGLTYPVALDVAESLGVGVTAKAFGLTGIPHMLVIDTKGKIVADTSEALDVEKAIQKLLGEK